MDTAGDNGDEVGLVRVELVQLGQEKLPFGLDDNLVSEELLEALQCGLKRAILLRPVVADCDLGFERSAMGLVTATRRLAFQAYMTYMEGIVLRKVQGDVDANIPESGRSSGRT